MTYKIYSITYDENQVVEYEKYDNSKIKTVNQKSYLFEYNVLIDVIDNHNIENIDYIGIFSWKFPKKSRIFKKKLEYLLNKNPNYDIYYFSRIDFHNKYLEFTEIYHPGFMKLFSLVCKDLGLEVKEPTHTIYSNFFIAKSDIYIRYVNEVVKPAIELLETKYKDLAWKNANYKSGLNPEILYSLTELKYYTFHTFILERLISIFIENNNFNVINIG